ncbi:MAG: DUF11 domain-containing protein [Chloroflexi bacterium]|nr:DUF11 domain-containing protein [Chloroflexota bacterium]
MNTHYRIMFALGAMILALLVLGLSALPQPVHAAGVWYVKNGGSDGSDCQTPATACASINAALAKPGFVAGDTIRVAVGTYTGTGSEVVLINKDATLSGGWDAATFATQSGMATIDGQGVRRGILLGNGNIVVVDRFAVQNGFDLNFAGSGGGISNNQSTLTVSNSAIISNTSSSATSFGLGGGIYNGGGASILTIINSTIKGNVADSSGGGVYNNGGSVTVSNTNIINNRAGMLGYPGNGGGGIYNSGTLVLSNTSVTGNTLLGETSGSGILGFSGALTLDNTTVSGNTYGVGILTWSGSVSLNNATISNNGWAGIKNYLGTINLKNTLIANNSTEDCSIEPGYAGTVNSLGYNLVRYNSNCSLVGSDLTNLDPKLGLLQDNGGSTLAHALLLGSPAINAGNPAGCSDNQGNILAIDQRGLARSDRCDIGAFETQPLEYSTMDVNKTSAVIGDSVVFTLVVQNSRNSNISNVLITDTLPSTLNYNVGTLNATSGVFGYSGGMITWNGNVNSGGQVTITFGATVNQTTTVGKTITNSATMYGGGEIRTISKGFEVISRLATSTKTASKSTGDQGDSVDYTIALANRGVTNTSNVLVSDTLPIELIYKNGSLNATSGNANYSNGVITWAGTVNAGANVTITFRTNIKPGLAFGTPITNSAIINSDGVVLTRTATVEVSFPHVFLPLISMPPIIYGYVTDNGTPAAGVPLELRFYDGSAWSTVATASTATDGKYTFFASALGSGQRYYVRYVNSAASTRLAYWGTRVLTSFAGTSDVAIGDFDIANITLVSPLSGNKVNVPATFSWGVRPATPTDSYEWNLFDPTNPNLAASTVPLGYVGNFTLNSLPGGFVPNVTYGWYVGVYGPDGGYGMSYYYRRVSFANSSAGPAFKAPVKPRSLPEPLPRPKVSPDR